MFHLQLLRSMSVAKKLGLLIGSAILGILVLMALFLVSERKLILEERKNNVRQVVEAAHGLLAHYHDLASKGTLSVDQAQQQALQAVKVLRYNGTEYFWINHLQPRMLMHPISRELMQAKDLSNRTEQQASSLEETAASMDQVTQQNAALVEEAAAAAQSLQEQAGGLSQVVSVFRPEGGHATAPARPPAHRQWARDKPGMVGSQSQDMAGVNA